jgi:hypothetical protein
MDRRAVALLAPALLALLATTGCSGSPRERPAGPAATAAATAGASSTPASEAGPAPAPEQALAGLSLGAPPRIGYAVAAHPTFMGGDWRLVRPDGTTQRFSPVPGLFVVRAGGVVHGFGTEGGFVVEVIDRDGAVVAEHAPLCHFSLATTPDRSVAGWLEDDGTLVTLGRSGGESRRPLELPGAACSGLDPVALRGDTVYADARYGSAGRERTPPYVLPAEGAPRPVRALAFVADADRRGSLIGRLSPRRPRCSARVGARGAVRWTTCERELVAFAPDGRHVLAVSGSLYYGNVRGVALLDRHGGVLARWDRAPHQLVDDVAWEDPGHALAVVWDRGTWSIVRLGLDGSAEYAVPPVRKGREFAPFRLPLD